MSTQDFSSRVVKGFAWTAITKFIVQVAQWSSTIIVARLLAPEDYGVMAIATAFTAFMEFVIELGFSSGLVHKSKTTREEEDGIFYISLLTGILLYALLYIFSPHIANFYDNLLLEDLIKFVGLTFVLTSLKVVPEALAMQELNFKYRALVEMFAGFVAAITGITMALYGAGVWSIAIALVANRLVTAIGYLPILKRIPSLKFQVSKTIGIVKFGLLNLGSGLLYFLYSRSEFIIAGKYISQKELGYYSMAFTLAEIPIEKIGVIFNKVAFPAISKIKEDINQAKNIFLKMHFYLVVISYPTLIGFILISDDLVLLVLTEKWLPIVPIFDMLCVINMMRISAMLMSPTLLGIGKPKIVLNYNILCAALIIPAIVIGVQFGIMGMVYAIFLANIPVYLFIMNRTFNYLEIKLVDFVATMVPAIIASVFMVISVQLVLELFEIDSSIVRMLATIATGAISYIATYFILFKDKIFEIKQGLKLLRS